MGSTNVPGFEMYRQAMVNTRYGVSCALAVLLFIMIFVVTLINRSAIRSEIEFEAH